MSDPLLLDTDDLRDLASDPVVRRGIGYFEEHRVTDLRFEERWMSALVDGSRPRHPYSVEIRLDDDDELLVDCDCPFRAEPACKHAVATLLAYGAARPLPEVTVEDAEDQAIATRTKRGRTQVMVEHLGGDRWFGTWRARSVGTSRDYTVRIHDLAERLNHCTCPDLATNRLGTCKHIEAVLHRLAQDDPDAFERLERQGPPFAVVHLAWDVPEAPAVAVRRPAGGGPELLDRHFGPDDLLAGPLPEAVHELQRAIRGREDVVIAEAVLEHSRRVAADAAHALRAERIRDEITASDGRLPGVRATLYPYQVDGVAFLASTGRALLADDMGLGKTLQTIAAATWLTEHEGIRRTLVVCPASLKHQWEREITRFTDATVQVIDGRPGARRAQYRAEAQFTVVNYELVLRDHEVIQRELAPDLLVLDEAQRIKNWRTKTATAVKSLDTRYAFVLTGTPLENRLEDLYSLMQVVDPHVLGPLWRYMIDFHVTTETGRVIGYRNLSELRRRLQPVMLRRDRRLVRDQLPDRIDLQVDVQLDKHQRPLHDEAVDGAAQIASRAKRERRPLTPSERNALMACLQTARRACDAAGLVDEEVTGSPKLSELERLLEELCLDGGHKVVVFSEWRGMTDRAETVIRRLGLGLVHLHGGVPTSRRGDLLDRFRDDPGVAVFLSTDAGGVGLNLQAASALINLDIPWNPAVLEQRIGRVHRLGQTEPVQVVRMIARDSYEERVAQLVAGKQELFRHTVTEDATEDAVGISKRTVQTALAALDRSDSGRAADSEEAADSADKPGEPAEAEGASTAGEDAPVADASGSDAPRGALDDYDLAPLVAAIGRLLGDRIERIVARSGGLVVIVDRLDPHVDEQVGEDAAVPVAVVDTRTAASLERMGVLEGREVAVPRRDDRPDPVRRELDAAAALLEAGHEAAALGHVARAMLGVLGRRAGISPPPVAGATRWLHGELAPQGLVDADDLVAVSRTLAFVDTDDVPPGLAALALADARRMASGAAPSEEPRVAWSK